MELNGYANLTLDATFAALADPTRRAILARLASGEASVMELAEPFAMSQPAISKHLKVLERAGLISRGSDAQRRPRRLEAAPLAEASEWLERYREFWEASFERLDSLLLEMNNAKAGSKNQKRKRVSPRRKK
jgi:DNA-binding transcriptional ArsR family regulator